MSGHGALWVRARLSSSIESYGYRDIKDAFARMETEIHCPITASGRVEFVNAAPAKYLQLDFGVSNNPHSGLQICEVVVT